MEDTNPFIPKSTEDQELFDEARKKLINDGHYYDMLSDKKIYL